jgi:DNA polymerase III subunit delta
MPALAPEQFLARVGKQPLAPVYLFLGPEGYHRRLCREALVKRVLPEDARADGLTQVDLEETSVSEVLDDARSLSLFAADRLIWVTSAELALPRRMTAAANDADEDSSSASSASPLAAYIKQPTPGTVIVFECSRYDFSGDDKARLDRVQKYYADAPVAVEFRPLTPESSRALAQDLARAHGLKLAGAELAALLDAVAGDANRLVSEIEKLSLFVEPGRTVTMNDLQSLVPNAAQTTIFNLVSALGKRDRPGALRALDILVRDGEYLPLALTFLGAQFRLALAAKESRISTAQQAQAAFSKMGVRIWRERAEQVIGTAGAFTREQLSKAISAIYETDKKFREGFRDDRIVMEGLVLALTQR